MIIYGIGQLMPDLFGNPDCAADVVDLEKNGKLLTAGSSEQVLLDQLVFNIACEADKGQVTGAVSETIVDQLEVINID
nr:hypothetical protein [Marinicella sp. W31]MDC2876919.1 hypothetical protein [Marinicella sp. W31]